METWQTILIGTGLGYILAFFAVKRTTCNVPVVQFASDMANFRTQCSSSTGLSELSLIEYYTKNAL